MRFDIMGINMFSAAASGYAIYYFCYLNYKIRPKIISTIIFIIVFGTVNGILSYYLIQGNELLKILKPIILLVLSTIIITFIIKTKFYQSVIAFILYTIAMSIGNASVPIIINSISGRFTSDNMLSSPYYLFLVNLISNLIACIIVFTIKPLKKNISVVLSKKATLPILCITFLVITANFGLHFYIKIYNLAEFIIIAFLSISYCAYILFASTKLIKQEATKMEIDQQKFYNESLNSTILSLRRLKHDWNNNLAVINSMLHMNKIQELKAYLSELIQQDLVGLNTDVYNIKNAGLFGIISSKLNEAREKGITVDFSVSGEVEDIPEIKISELCEIIGIFIDNAIEEVINGDKSITTSIYNDDANLEITISNSCADKRDIEMINKAGHSSKGEGRGLGLAIVKQIISKYNNIQHVTDFEDNIFSQTITIEKGS